MSPRPKKERDICVDETDAESLSLFYEETVTCSGQTVAADRSSIGVFAIELAVRSRAEKDCQKRNKQSRRGAQKVKRRVEAPPLQPTSLSHSLGSNERTHSKSVQNPAAVVSGRQGSSWLCPFSFPLWKLSVFQLLFIYSLSKFMHLCISHN